MKLVFEGTSTNSVIAVLRVIPAKARPRPDRGRGRDYTRIHMTGAEVFQSILPMKNKWIPDQVGDDKTFYRINRGALDTKLFGLADDVETKRSKSSRAQKD